MRPCQIRRGFAKLDTPDAALCPAIKANAEALAVASGLTVDYIRKKNFRKEDKIKAVPAERGMAPGLVWVFSAPEPCTAYQPWHDKKTGRTFLRTDDGKRPHYYFCFIDEEPGLRCVRVPAWCPFRLQYYCRPSAQPHGRSPLSLFGAGGFSCNSIFREVLLRTGSGK